MTQEGFLTDLHTTELFFRVCRRYKIDGREPRLSLLRLLSKCGKARYIRDVAQFTAGQTVLKITRKRDTNDL